MQSYKILNIYRSRDKRVKLCYRKQFIFISLKSDINLKMVIFSFGTSCISARQQDYIGETRTRSHLQNKRLSFRIETETNF